MRLKRKVPIITIAIFIIFMLAISSMHIWTNLKLLKRRPSPDWSGEFTVGDYNTTYKRTIIKEIDNDKFILVYFTDEDSEKLNIAKVDKKLKVLDKYNVELDGLSYHRIFSSEYYLKDKDFYWRDYKDNSLYKGSFNDNYKKLSNREKVFDNIKHFSFYENGEETYLALAYTDGSVEVLKKEDAGFVKLDSPKNLKGIVKVGLEKFNDTIYLQAIENESRRSSDIKRIYVSEYKEKSWSNPILMDEVMEVKAGLKDAQIGIDGNYVYNISTVEQNGVNTYIYNLSSYDKTTKELSTKKGIERASEIGVDGFADVPTLVSNDGDLIVYTTGLTNLDKMSKRANVIKLTLSGDDMKDVKLLSNTLRWSSNVSFIKTDNYKYVFWTDPMDIDDRTIFAASNDPELVAKDEKIVFEDFKQALYLQLPVIIYAVFNVFGVRFMSILPALLLLVVLIIFNEKIEKRFWLVFILAAIVNTIVQINSMDFFYDGITYSYIPEFLKISYAEYIVPIAFTILGIITSWILKKEKPLISIGVTYIIYLLISVIMLNFLYGQYVYMNSIFI